MELYDELKQAISECMNDSEESPEFKRRFSTLIQNYFTHNANENEIKDVITLIKVPEDSR